MYIIYMEVRMNNNQNATGGQVIEFMNRLDANQFMQVSENFEAIISCQLHLMLQRGIPAEKIIEIVQNIDSQMKASVMEEDSSFDQASGQK